MPNGKIGDNPLSDLSIHGVHRFPEDIVDLLLKIQAAGRRDGRWPLGENWPFSPREFDWQLGKDLDGARRDLTLMLNLIETGRGDDILIDSKTGRPFAEGER